MCKPKALLSKHPAGSQNILLAAELRKLEINTLAPYVEEMKSLLPVLPVAVVHMEITHAHLSCQCHCH